MKLHDPAPAGNKEGVRQRGTGRERRLHTGRRQPGILLRSCWPQAEAHKTQKYRVFVTVCHSSGVHTDTHPSSFSALTQGMSDQDEHTETAPSTVLKGTVFAKGLAENSSHCCLNKKPRSNPEVTLSARCSAKSILLLKRHHQSYSGACLAEKPPLYFGTC